MKTLQYLGVALLATQLTACFDKGKGLPTPEDNTNTEAPTVETRLPYQAVIATNNFSAGGIQIATINQNEDGHSTLSGTVFSASAGGFPDYTVSAFGDYFYHIGKYGIDQITKHHIDQPETNVWGDAWDASGDDYSGNSYEMVFVNDSKAYLIRYDSDKVWIVNPSATDEADFKIGEIDLSSYNAGNNDNPNPTAGLVIGDKLFILMQRFDEGWCPDDAFVAVYDTKTNQPSKYNEYWNKPLVDVKIQLQTKNPSGMDYQEDVGIVIGSVGEGTLFGSCDATRYTGGIEVINQFTYETRLVLDDGDDANHPYDFISRAIALDKNNGYFVSYADWGDTRLYHFNPTTGDVTGVVEGFGDNAMMDIRVLKKTPDNTAWVGVAGSDNGFYILNKEQEIEQEFALEAGPDAVSFVFTPKPVDTSTMPEFPFPPKAGVEGSTAIAHDDPAFVAWATGYENYRIGPGVDEQWKTPEKALGKAGDSANTGNPNFVFDIVVLGRAGEITLTFDKPIRNGEGADFAVFENANTVMLELAWVEVSSDGENFYRFPNYSFTENPVTAYGATDPTMIHNLAGKYAAGYGTPFDLEDLKGTKGLDINNITHVKIVDIVGNGAALDSLGNSIYEAYPTSGSGGFDLDAVGVIHQAD